MSGKKAEQRLKKQQKQAAARRKATLAGWAWKLALLILVPLAAVVLLQGLFRGAEAVAPEQLTDSDHVRGNTDASLVLTVYGDFQCPACREEALTLGRAWPRIQDDLTLVFRHFPLDIHRHAFLAARYAEAAGRQGMFWEFHDLLYANQQLWSASDFAADIFDEYAESLGLDLARLQADIEDPALRDKILVDQRGGIRAGVRSTPSLFLNGRLIDNPRTAGELVTLVQRALAAQAEAEGAGA